jgi:hypothetical protein
MPRYFFDVKNDHRLVDPAGLDCRNDQEAIAKAIFIAQTIAAETSETPGERQVAFMNSSSIWRLSVLASE